jgi:PAS domain S-box-containing protein
MSSVATEPGFGHGRRYGGPLLVVAIAAVVELLAGTAWRVPNPPALLLLAVVFAAFTGGRAPGLIAAAIAWTYCAYFFSASLQPLRYAPDDARRVVVWLLAMPAMAWMVGTLRRRVEAGAAKTREAEIVLAAESRLRASEARFRAIADSAPVAIFETDAEGANLFVNRRWCELTGRSGEEAAGGGWLQAVHPEDRERIRGGWFARGAEDKVLSTTYRLLARDGTVRWVEGRATEMRGANGELTGFLGTLVDVTDVRRAEELARRRGAILGAVSFAGAQLLRRADWREGLDAVLRALGEAAEVSRVYLFENHAGASGEVCCSQRAEWVADGIAPQIDNPDLQSFPYRESGFGRWLDAFAAGNAIHGQVASFPASEREILAPQAILSLAVLPIVAGGEVWGFLGFDDCRQARVWSDVELDALRTAVTTLGAAIDRRQAELELRESEQRARELFDSSPVEIWEEDFSAVREYLEGEGFFAADDPSAFLDRRPETLSAALAEVRVVDVNRQAVERLGARDKAELLAGLDRVFTEEAFAAFRRELIAMHQGETRLVLESKSRTFDGRTLETVLHWEVQPGHERDFGRVLVSVLDVSEQRALRQQMERAGRLEMIGKLAGGVAHDFNNLLTIVLGTSELLAREVADDERAMAEVERIQSAARRAADLTRQLLAFGRRQVLTPRPVDLNQALGELRALLTRVLPENIQLRLDLCAEAAVVEIDPAQLEQVLVNLVVNARDALPAGGEIAIETSRLPAPPPDMPQREEPVAGGGVLLAVHDDGVGMDRATLERCFEPFFSRKSLTEGSGLGLATAYGIVQQSGGAIWAESEPGRGSTFFVYLPGGGHAGDAPATDAVAGGGDETILVVEDDDAVRGMVGKLLRSLGYAVRETRSPLDALALLERQEAVDLLLTDIVMAEISGDQLAARATAQRPDVKVLFMSGYAEDMVKRPAAANRFLPKPFTRAQLATAVRAALEHG